MSHRTRVWVIAIAVGCLLGLAGTAMAQQPVQVPDREAPDVARPEPPTPTARSGPAAHVATGTIEGTVTDATTGDPLEGITVSANLDFFGFPFSEATAVTAADGTFSMAVGPGQYRVLFGEKDAYPGEWYDDARTYEAARTVTVRDGATVTADAALAKGTPVSGTVRDSSGTGVAASIVALAVDGGTFPFAAPAAAAAADGSYSFAGLAPNTYDFEFSFDGLQDITIEDVAVGTTPLTLDATLPAGGVLTGTITDAAGAPVGGASLFARTPELFFTGVIGTTDAAGEYRLAGLAPGSYLVDVGFEDQYEWLGGPSLSAADLVAVTDGGTTTVDHQFDATGTLAGTVTSAADGAPVADIRVFVQFTDERCCQSTTFTAADGTFTFSGLSPREYVVGVFAKDFFVGHTLPDPVAVTAGGTTTRNVALETGGTVTGTLVDRATGGPAVAGYIPGIYDTLFGFVADGLGLADGFEIEGVPAGTYKLLDFIFGGPFPWQWHDGKPDFDAADTLTVAAGTDTALASNAEVGEAAITGRIVDAATGAGIPGAGVRVSFGPYFILSAFTRTSGDGTYALRGVPAGSHLVSASAEGYATSFIGPDPTPERQLAQPIAFLPGAPTAVDGALTPAATITATVTRAADGSRVTGACLSLFGADGRPQRFTTVRESGVIDATVLPGTYTVRFANCVDPYSSLGEVWLGGTSAATATPRTFAPGETVDLDTALPPGGAITGTVTDAATGAPVAGICVIAYEVGSRVATSTGEFDTPVTDEAGRYEIDNLGAADHHVYAFDCDDAPPFHLAAWYPGAPSRRLATPVSVPAGATVGGRDFAVSTGAGIVEVAPRTRPVTTGAGTTAADPVATSLLSPFASFTSLSEGSAAPPIAGYDLFPAIVAGSQFPVLPERPYALTIELDASLVGGAPVGAITAFHEGVPVPPCRGAAVAVACVVSIGAQADGDVVADVRSRWVGDWTFGTPSPAQVGLVDPGTGRWYLRTGGAPTPFVFGDPGDHPVVGDWDCDGIATPGAFRPATGRVHLRNSNSFGPPHVSFTLGDPGDVPLAGDFDGDGCDTIAVYRPANQHVFVFNELGNGDPASVFTFGDPGDVPFAGDFDGDGIDTVGLHRPSTGRLYFRNSLTTGVADADFVYGNPADRFVADDWDGDAVDTPGIFRPSEAKFYLRNANSIGIADEVFSFGEGPWLPVSGYFGP